MRCVRINWDGGLVGSHVRSFAGGVSSSRSYPCRSLAVMSAKKLGSGLGLSILGPSGAGEMSKVRALVEVAAQVG